MDTILPSGKKIGDLKVSQLKKELAKRRFSTIGKKSELAERLIQSLIEENDQMDAEEMSCVQENDQATPLKSINVFDDAQIRKSSRAERYAKPADTETENNNSFLSEDEDNDTVRGVRRSSSIRRSVFKSLGLENEASLLQSSTTPDRATKRINCVALRTRSRSRERTVDISPDSSRILEALSTPKSSHTIRTPGRSTSSIRRKVIKEPASRRSGSVEPVNAKQQTMKRRSNSMDPASARKPPVHPSSTRRHERVNRFAAQHQKLFESQMTLGEHRDHLQRRHQELTQGVSDGLKRLATPKKVVVNRMPVRVTENLRSNTGFKFDTETTKNDFKFGALNPEDYSNIPKKKPTSVQRTANKMIPHQIDAKALSKNNRKIITKPLTRPADETRIEYLATPKGKTPVKTPSRHGYAPHTGALGKFIDTSKLSDRELELAREAGLVKQTSTRKTTEQLEKNKKKREDLHNLRRKLDL